MDKIVILGGTGQVGTILARSFHRKGCEVIVTGRHPVKVPWRFVRWDGRTLGDWTAEIDGADAVINLAGRSVNCRYTQKNRRLITESRVASTLLLAEAIRRTSRPPPVWLQAATATIYSHRYDAPNDEIAGIIGGVEPDVPETWRFSIDVATAWERAAFASVLPATRLVVLRSAMVMSPDRGGVFDTLLRLVRFGLGGRQGHGRQYVSWIHETDFVRAVEWLLKKQAISGPINLCSPNPLPNAEFMAALRRAWGIYFGLPSTGWMLEIGAFFLRTETELILKSRRVVPGLLDQNGFRFNFPDWPEAAQDLVYRWRSVHFRPKENETGIIPASDRNGAGTKSGPF